MKREELLLPTSSESQFWEKHKLDRHIFINTSGVKDSFLTDLITHAIKCRDTEWKSHITQYFKEEDEKPSDALQEQKTSTKGLIPKEKENATGGE